MDTDTRPMIRALLGEPRGRGSSPSHAALVLPSAPEEQEFSAYALGRVGKRPQLNVEFRKSDGSIETYSYTHFSRIKSENPADGFTVLFPPYRVVVLGRNLSELYYFIRLHWAFEVAEASQAEALALPADKPVVEAIEFQR